jgi:hypothetical protein
VLLIKFSEHELSTCNESPEVKWKTFEYIDIKTKHGTWEVFNEVLELGSKVMTYERLLNFL